MFDLYDELTQYVKRDRKLVEERCKTAVIELAWQWETYKKDPIAYYRDSDLYIFDLTNYQTLLQRGGFHWLLMDYLKKHQCKTILDFGGGIGQYTILTMQNGMKADYLEIEKSKTMEYAKWRFYRYNLTPEILTEKSDLTKKKYDCIVAMDVFEHIENPDPIIKQLSEITNYIVANPDELPYNSIYPQHISKYTLDVYFEKVDNYFYKKRVSPLETVTMCLPKEDEKK